MSVRIPRSSCLMGTLLIEGSSSRIVFLSMVVFKFSVQLGYYTVPGQLREYVYFSCPHTGIKQQLHSFIHTWVGWLCRKVDIHRDTVYLLHHIDTHINKRNNLKEGLHARMEWYFCFISILSHEIHSLSGGSYRKHEWQLGPTTSNQHA